MKASYFLGVLGLLHAGASHAGFTDYSRWLDLQDSTVQVSGSSKHVVIDDRHYERFELELSGIPDRVGAGEAVLFDYRLNARLADGAKLASFSSSPMTVYARYSQWDPDFKWQGGYNLRLPGQVTSAALSITNGTCDPEGYICWGWGQLPGYQYEWQDPGQHVGTFAALSAADVSVYASSIIFGPDNGPDNDPLSLGVPKITLSFLAPVSPVPEPATYALMAGGLAALLLRRRRHR
ncbi:PEP-CTERM sorting domain-containing protein [Chitinolyticbacter meiyuanensis]|uniref:PEP-CTERM sorting domain-containing protein n=1 Tax=Chitinolyticbacter meiyuanensis TaxID=682798 RepID=UPI001C9E618B|nr:PEP-CTERM sorting domain-containing protein [Chitinolyticbacter meiyuanensis]